MTRNTRLELTWIGKETRPRVEPRILIEDEFRGHLAKARSSEDVFDNRLVFGDNLLALKALEAEFVGKVQCVYIDPPYNTGSAFSQFDDGVEHSLWLSLIRDRIELLWRLLDNRKGSLWVSIDDREMAYLKVLLDEVCGRNSFVATIVWQKRYSRENREAIGDAHEYILVYARDVDQFKLARNQLPLGEKQLAVYKNSNNDPKGPWRAVSLSAQGFRPNQMYEIVSPITGKRHKPPQGSCWKIIEPEYMKALSEGRIYFGKDGNAVPSRIQYLKDISGIAPWTWWPHEECGHTDEAKKEAQTLFGKLESFETPKPERLIERIIRIATNPGDLVLDSFAGSGTTGAVAHKLNRRWIMVELGEHCHTHIIPRLQKVIDGEDGGGITEATAWKGGGGFRYFRLAPSLIEKDRWGNAIIAKAYNAPMLAEAMCRHMGFTYAPSADAHEYWRHGFSSERDFIFVTTASLTFDVLKRLSEDVGPQRSLLVCCRAFQGKTDSLINLTVKKIPQAVLANCEWGRDDYSLRIASIPLRDDDGSAQEAQANLPSNARKNGKGKAKATNQPTLFEGRE